MLVLLACATVSSPVACVDTAAAPLPMVGALGCVPPAPTHFVLAGAHVAGLGVADVEVDAGKIVAIGEVSDVPRVDVSGHWITAAGIDSHVHLAYDRRTIEMAAGGIAAAVDLASPTEFLAEEHAPLRLVAAGPMITAFGGYPTEGWGRNGYGLEVSTAEEASAAVDTLHALGAGVVKIPIDTGPALSPEALSAAITRAHALGLRVVSHALDDASAARAAEAGVDALAHTPVSALAPETLVAWSGRAVISTLGAFGGGDAAVANLASLRAAGVTVLYGTDFGNTQTAGIDPTELALLVEAGMTPEEILAALTSTPALYWGLSDLGSVEVGKTASLLVLDRDPLVDPLALAAPAQVWLAGARM